MKQTTLPFEQTTEDFSLLESHLGHSFQDKALLREALTHKSYVHEHSEARDNERLEFLGDAVLDLAMAHLLMLKYRDATEGELSSLRSSLVSEQHLVLQAQEIQLGEWLFIGKGEEINGGRQKPSLLADAYEAVLGAIFLEKGFSYAFEIIQRLFLSSLHKDHDTLHNNKSKLQEYLQSHKLGLPKYEVLSEDGPEHSKRFFIAVWVGSEIIGEGQGKTKREAEQRAANSALKKLRG